MTTPQLFEPGQEVYCIDELCIAVNPAKQGMPDVFYGKKYTIKQYERFEYNIWWVSLVGLTEGMIYSEDSFIPLEEFEEKIEMLNYEMA